MTDRIVERVCLVTGATSGIGKATVQALAEIGATTILVAHDRARGEATVEEIRRTTGSDRVEILVADLSSQDSIRELAEVFRRDHDRLDVLVNCAGAFFRRRRVTVDGIEMTFALNHLAYFLLTNQLLDLLKRTGSARILNVTAPATTKIHFDDLQGERRYRPFTAFGASKVANLMFTFELARRLEGTGVTVNAVHPGRVRSSIMREAPAPFRMLTWLALRLRRARRPVRGRSRDRTRARREHRPLLPRPEGDPSDRRGNGHATSAPTLGGERGAHEIDNRHLTAIERFRTRPRKATGLRLPWPPRVHAHERCPIPTRRPSRP